ncbi:hypothetical protein [uncultured Sphingomonas sp.]|uniref:hypothetical protein n=1 Tax=uncultured Sphingomonas sp. TaxID=158754 RepID=UPI0025F22245|nr:hypothetical protein [uncultured Sphingomonas sp.]
MLRRHALPLILIASAVPLAACSKLEPSNSTALDNGGVANDELLANDEGPVDGNATFGNDVLLDNEAAPGGTNAS